MKAGPIRCQWNVVGLDVVQSHHGKVVMVEHDWTQDSGEITAGVIPADRDGQRWTGSRYIRNRRKPACCHKMRQIHVRFGERRFCPHQITRTTPEE